MWSNHDWVCRFCRPSDHILYLLTDDKNDKPNHDSTTYCVYWRTTTINPTIIRPYIMSTDRRLALSLLSSVSRHNIWSYYGWVYCCCRPSVNTICRRISHKTTTYCFYWRTTTTINPVIMRPPIVFTDGRQQRQPNHNTTTYCVYWRKHNMWSYYDWVYCCFRPSVNTICGRIMTGFIVVVVRQ
jgi:hypothetical protein